MAFIPVQCILFGLMVVAVSSQLFVCANRGEGWPRPFRWWLHGPLKRLKVAMWMWSPLYFVFIFLSLSVRSQLPQLKNKYLFQNKHVQCLFL